MVASFIKLAFSAAIFSITHSAFINTQSNDVIIQNKMIAPCGINTPANVVFTNKQVGVAKVTNDILNNDRQGLGILNNDRQVILNNDRQGLGILNNGRQGILNNDRQGLGILNNGRQGLV